MRKTLLPVACVLISIALGLQMNSQSTICPADSSMTPVPAQPRNEIWAPGQVETHESQLHVFGRVPGEIIKLNCALGDWVEAGTILAVIDPEEFKHNVEISRSQLLAARATLESLRKGPRVESIDAAKAELRAVESQLQQATRDFHRTQSLSGSQSVSQQTLEANDSNVRRLQSAVAAQRARLNQLVRGTTHEDISAARARVSAAQSHLDLADLQLRRTAIRAPISGQILDLNVRQGQMILMTDQQPILTLADTSRIRIRAWVDELSAGKISLGQTAIVSVDGMPDKILGRVSEISPRIASNYVDSENIRYRADAWTREVWIDTDSCNHFVVGMRVDVVISF